MEPTTIHSHHKILMIYISIMLTLTVILLAGIVAAMIYGGDQLQRASNNVNAKVDSFSTQMNSIDQNLQNIDKQLQTKPTISGLPTVL